MITAATLMTLIFYAFVGALVALMGILKTFRQTVKQGVWVPIKNLQRDPELLDAIKNLRPYCLLSKWEETESYQKFVELVDTGVGNPSVAFHSLNFAENCLQKMKEALTRPTPPEILQRLRRLLLNYTRTFSNSHSDM